MRHPNLFFQTTSHPLERKRSLALQCLASLCLLLLLPQLSFAVGSAKRTFDGTDGVSSTFFSQCTSCHSSAGGQTPYWTSYSTASSNYANIYNRAVTLNDMPPPSGGASNKTHLTGWNTDGLLRYDAPYIATGSSSSTVRNGTNNYQRNISFTVNENGDNASFTAYYRKGAGSWSSTSSSSPAGDGGGDTSSNTTSSATLTGLTCGTYSYYLSGTNSAGTSSGFVDNQNSFSITCNTGATLSGSPGTATEDSLFTWTPTVSAGAGSDDLTFSFSVGPTVTGGNTSNTPSINSNTGQISWTPTEGNTQASFTIQVSDADADTSITDTLAVTINANAIIDEDPVITTASIPTGTEDTTNYSIQFNATDADTSDTETWTITAESDAQMSITTGGLFTWSPVEGEAGAHSVTIQVEDSGGLTDSQVYNFTVNQDHTAPVITTTPGTPETTDEDSQITINFAASDVDSPHTHTWAITSPTLPFDGMAINSTTGEFTWSPSSDADVTQAVTVRVTDDGTLYDEVSFNIDVSGIDDEDPVITTSSLPGGTEEVPYSQFLSFTDADTDGDSWTWSILPGYMAQRSDGPDAVPTNALAIDPSTGEVTWQPANNETSVTFTARITDSDGDLDDQALSIAVTAENDAPVIQNTPIATQAATENSVFSIDIDSIDPDSPDSETWTIESPASPPDNMAIDGNGVLTWTPTTDDPLTQPVTIRITDSGALYDEVSFNIDVTPVIDNAPVITTIQGDLAASTTEDLESFSHTMEWADADTSGDDWTWSITAQDATTGDAIAIDPDTGEITWSPEEGDGEIGSFNFTARVTDDGGFWDDIDLVINVAEDNDAPTISGKPIADQEATEDLLFSIDLNKTDPDFNDTEAWAITSPASLPDDMTINASGILSWTPSEGLDRTETVTVEVTDEGGLTDSHSFDINVTAVNDAPVFDTAIPNDMEVEEHSDFSYTVDVSDTDPQDNPFNDFHSFSITSVSPTPNSAGPQIDSTGQITWTPGNNDARTVDDEADEQLYTIEVTVADGGEDSQDPAVSTFTLLVTLLDTDADTVPDYEDNCPVDINTQQENFDEDAEGDICDPDDDNDGISDIAEDYHSNNTPPIGSLDPFDDSDALGDIDGDGLSNLEEFNTCTGSDIDSPLTCENIRVDSVPPVIVHSGDIDTIAAGYTTYVEYSATAVDGIDGPVVVTADLTETHLRPGDHTITWTAMDEAGNIGTEEQIITIHPLLSLGGSQVLAEGASGIATLSFNGDIPAADYPVNITLSTSGTSSIGSDFSITPSSPITINDAGDLVDNEFMLTIDAINDGPGENDESLTISLNNLSPGPVFGSSTQHKIIITEGQIPPTANLSAEQNAIETQTIFGDQGSVTVYANALDGNGDALGFNWSASDSELSGVANNDEFSFDPSTLTVAEENLPKIYQVRVQITDGVHTINKTLSLSYRGDNLSLGSVDSDGDGINDDIEGVGDSDEDGIPDYLDAYDNPPELLFSGNESDGDSAPEFIQTESGFQLSLGNFAASNDENSPELNLTDLQNLGANVVDEGYVHFGSVYDLQISGFSDASGTAYLVIPIMYNIPPGAEIRLFDGTSWFAFTINSENNFASATSDENACPAYDSDDYQEGIRAYRNCILVQISDGGPNDIDGTANGTINLIVGLALPDDAEVFEPEVEIDEAALPSTGRFIYILALLSLLLITRTSALKISNSLKTKKQ